MLERRGWLDECVSSARCECFHRGGDDGCGCTFGRRKRRCLRERTTPTVARLVVQYGLQRSRMQPRRGCYVCATLALEEQGKPEREVRSMRRTE